MSVELKIACHAATVTLARPEALNAVDLATEADLQCIWAALEVNREVRAIVLTGAGERAFCVGADMENPSNSSPLAGLEYWAAPRPAALAASRCAGP